MCVSWESNCPFGFLQVMFPLGSSYFEFVFLSLWCLRWEVWDNCIDSWSLPSLLFFMMSLFEEKHSEVIEAFSSTSRYLDDLLHIDNIYFDCLISQIHPSELQLNTTNSSKTGAQFWDLHLSILDGFISCTIFDKRDYFDFEIVNFPYLDEDVPCRASYGVYISQLIRFARMSSHITNINTWNNY